MSQSTVMHFCGLKVLQAFYELKFFIQILRKVAEVICILLHKGIKFSVSNFCILQWQPLNSMPISIYFVAV